MSNPATRINQEDLQLFLKKPRHTFPGLGSALRMAMEKLVNRGPSPEQLQHYVKYQRQIMESRAKDLADLAERSRVRAVEEAGKRAREASARMMGNADKFGDAAEVA